MAMRYIPQGGLVCSLMMLITVWLCFIPHFLCGVARVYYLFLKRMFIGLSSCSIPSFPVCSALTTAAKHYGVHFTFDSDATAVVVDNSANTHIWNVLEDFDNYVPLNPEDIPGVTTINSNSEYPKGCGNITVKIQDDNGVMHDLFLRNALYFPKSAVKIMSVTNLAKEYPDEDGSPDKHGTSVHTHYDYSILKWDHGKFAKTFDHPTHNIPEVAVNEGVRSFESFTTSLDTRSTPVRAARNSSVFWSKQVNMMNAEETVPLKFKKGERLILQEA